MTETDTIYVELDNGKIYAFDVEILSLYKIKNNFLYRNDKKLGKIIKFLKNEIVVEEREALNNLRKRIIHPEYFGKNEMLNELANIEKELKVLEIIKNKLVFPLALMSLPYELYNNSVMKEQQLTQEEYNKVKEYLKS